MEKAINAVPIKHKDIRGKELTYVKFDNGSEELIINVGDKTYEKLVSMQKVEQEDQSQLSLELNGTDNKVLENNTPAGGLGDGRASNERAGNEGVQTGKQDKENKPKK